MNTFVIGAGATEFGELWQSSQKTLARRAFDAAIRDSDLDKKKIEALFVGNMFSGILEGQINLGAFCARDLGLTDIPAFHIEGADASGGLAVHAAVCSVLSGKYGTVAVIGLEKATDHMAEDISRAQMGSSSEEEQASGMTFPGLYAIMAQAYAREYNAAEIERASVPVKNHFHASLNPNARFHNILTVDTVLKSPRVADPLKLLECAPVSDGAAALIIASRPGKVEIVASETATDCPGLAQRENLTGLKSTRIAARNAYEKSGLSANDIDIAEVHDCFSIAEIMALEDLGFFSKGESGRAISEGRVTLGQTKRLAVNTSGGLKGAGHTGGASGVSQIAEIIDQLTGRAKARQAKSARIGLAQNVGGSGATAVIHILKYHG